MAGSQLSLTICAYDGRGYFGGPLEWYKRLAPALREVGIETRFLFITDHPPAECGTYRYLKDAGFNCRALPRHSLSQLRDYTEPRVRWILRQLRRNPPDLFLANLSVPACFAARWAREAGIPSAPVVHSDDPFYTAMAEEFLGQPGPYRFEVVVCVSRMLEQSLQARGSGRIEHIPCGTPVPSRRTEWPGNGPLRIAYVGRLVDKAKRIGLLADAFCRAVLAVPGTEAILIGDGPQRMEVEQIIQSHGCGGRVTLTGRMDSSGIQERLLDCHVIVLLSDFEGLPMALLEGMACGAVPVCLSIRSGIPELVEHEQTGLLVQDRGESFVEAIRRLRTDRALWERLSAAARQRIEARYSMPVVARQWRDLIESLRVPPAGRRPIRIPHRLKLPPVHPGLAGDDRRWPGWGGYARRQFHRIGRRCGRQSLEPG
ncbi:MAG: glycosyltransferase family 4 protein [Kiritimatiellae bacterium]|nr:glycosyltransferase family 4 protein [Kiritimatiellia bacterium]